MIIKRLQSLLLATLCVLTSALAQAAEQEFKEFNLGFYYDKDAARNVKRLGGMEMHAHICASQFNQALFSAGITDVWVNPKVIAELDYDGEGDTKDALLRHIAEEAPEAIDELETYKLDFIIVFVCLNYDEAASERTLGVTISLYHRPGEFDAGDDHKAQWAEELIGSDIEGVFFDVIETPIPDKPGKVRLTYVYRVLALDLYEALNSYTFTHELGHIFGAGHSRDQNEQRGPSSEDFTPYASGTYLTIKEDGEKYHYCSVMSYNDAGYTDSGIQYIQLPMFSSPRPQIIGSHGETVLGSREDDNARAVQENAYLLAANRPYEIEDDEGAIDGTVTGEYVEYDPNAATEDAPALPTFSTWAPEFLLEQS